MTIVITLTWADLIVYLIAVVVTYCLWCVVQSYPEMQSYLYGSKDYRRWRDEDE